MIIEVLNDEKKCVGYVKTYEKLKKESWLKMGTKNITFACVAAEGTKIKNEFYLRMGDDEYVIRENSKAAAGRRNIVAELNIEDIKGSAFTKFETPAGGSTAKECAEAILKGTGWSCVSDIEEYKRGLAMANASAYEIFESICDAFTCEIEWDTIKKIVYLKKNVGKDRGAYFTTGINLQELNDANESYDFFTRIIPIGADSLDISEVNNGCNYLENFQYSNKIKTLIWEDTNYKDAAALKKDAEYKLNELSKPRKTFSVKIIDLAKIKPDYGFLQYNIGDTILLIDSETGTYDKQRVVKMVEYPEEPQNNTCELSNTVLSFEEMQKRLFAAANTVNNVTNGNIVIGPKVQGMRASQIKDLEIYSTEALTNTDIENICK